MNPSLTHTIMRRVFYAFAIHMATRPIVRRGVVLAILAYALSVLVHVSAILSNISAVGFKHFGTYVLDALLHTEWLTLLIFVGILFIVLRTIADAVGSLTPRETARA